MFCWTWILSATKLCLLSFDNLTINVLMGLKNNKKLVLSHNQFFSYETRPIWHTINLVVQMLTVSWTVRIHNCPLGWLKLPHCNWHIIIVCRLVSLSLVLRLLSTLQFKNWCPCEFIELKKLHFHVICFCCYSGFLPSF